MQRNVPQSPARPLLQEMLKTRQHGGSIFMTFFIGTRKSRLQRLAWKFVYHLVAVFTMKVPVLGSHGLLQTVPAVENGYVGEVAVTLKRKADLEMPHSLHRSKTICNYCSTGFIDP